MRAWASATEIVDRAGPPLKTRSRRSNDGSAPASWRSFTFPRTTMTSSPERRTRRWRPISCGSGPIPEIRSRPTISSSGYAANGKYDQALPEALETVRLAPNEALSYQNLGGDYLGLNRFAEAKAVREKQIAANLDNAGDHAELYVIAFVESDTAAMQRQAEWARGKPDEFDMLQVVAEAAASRGKLQKAREVYGQAADVARRGKFEEIVARIMALHAGDEALVGNAAQARDRSAAALAVSRNRPTLVLSATAFAHAGDVTNATALADELSRRFPL